METFPQENNRSWYLYKHSQVYVMDGDILRHPTGQLAEMETVLECNEDCHDTHTHNRAAVLMMLIII